MTAARNKSHRPRGSGHRNGTRTQAQRDRDHETTQRRLMIKELNRRGIAESRDLSRRPTEWLTKFYHGHITASA